MKKLLLILLFLPMIGFGQYFFTSNCNNGYFNFYCTDYDCNLSFFEDQSFVAQESDSTSLIAWLSLTSDDFGDVTTNIIHANSFNVINNPGITSRRFAGLILSNDDIVIASFDKIKRLSPSQNQFNMDLLSSNLSFDLNWENLYEFDSYNCGLGTNPNTNFCEGNNGDIYFAYCANGMTNIIKIGNDSIEIIADSLSGSSIKSLAFHDDILYVANSEYVYKYESNILTNLNFQLATSLDSIHFMEINTLEINNNGIPYVVAMNDTNFYSSIYKYIGNNWVEINNSFSFFTYDSRDFLDFDSTNIGYLLTENTSSPGLSIYRILNDSVDLFYNFYPDSITLNSWTYAFELDNFDKPYIVFTNGNDKKIITYDGIDWVYIVNNPMMSLSYAPDGFDLQFNSYNDLYIMGCDIGPQGASVVTFCHCDLEPYNSPTNLSNNSSYSKNLIKIINTLGKEVLTDCKNQPLFYIYDDGTVEKRIVIE